MAAMILIRLTPAEDLLKVTDRFPVRLIRAWSLSLGGSPMEDTESPPMVSPGAVLSLQTAMHLSHPALLSTGATTLVSADTVTAQMCQRTGRQRRLSSQTGLSLENWSILLLYMSLCLQLKGEREIIVEFLPLKPPFPDGCPHCLLVPWVFWAVVFCAAEASSGLPIT